MAFPKEQIHSQISEQLWALKARAIATRGRTKNRLRHFGPPAKVEQTLL